MVRFQLIFFCLFQYVLRASELSGRAQETIVNNELSYIHVHKLNIYVYETVRDSADNAFNN